jgi:hypothetical protein
MEKRKGRRKVGNCRDGEGEEKKEKGRSETGLYWFRYEKIKKSTARAA